MEHKILILWGLIMFIDSLFDKWHFWHHIETFGEQQKISIHLYNLTHCRFCCLFWLTNIIWFFAMLLRFFDWTTFWVVFIVAGLNSIKHKP